MHVYLREVKNNPSDTLIYGISCDGSKNFNIRTCEHMILGHLRIGARQAKNAPLVLTGSARHLTPHELHSGRRMLLVKWGKSTLNMGGNDSLSWQVDKYQDF